MPQVRKQIFYKRDAGAWYARLDKEGGGTFTRKLATKEEAETKLVQGRKRTRTEAEVNNYLQSLLLDVKPPEVKKSIPANKLTVMAAARQWLASLAVADATKTHYEYAINGFVASLPKETLLSSLKRTDSRPFINDCRERGLSDNTIRSYLRGVAIFLTWAVDSELLVAAPKLERPAPVKKEVRVYSQDQLDELEEYLEHDLERKNIYRMVMALRYLGLRAGEVQHLALADIDLNQEYDRQEDVHYGKLHIRGGKNKDGWLPKKGKEEVLPLIGKFYRFLKADLADRGPEEIWYLDRGDGKHYRQDAHGLSSALLKPLSELKIAQVAKTMHGFRASCASTLARDNVNHIYIQQILRHESFDTTLKYLHSSMGELAKALDKL